MSRRRTCALPVLVIAPWRRVAPEELSEGTRPRKAARLRPLKRCQSPISTAKPEGGERRDAAQAAEARHDLCPRLLEGLGGDGAIEGIAAVAGGEHRLKGLLVGELQGRLSEALAGRPELVRVRPEATLSGDAATQQQLGEPMTVAHQIATGVLASPHQIASRLLR